MKPSNQPIEQLVKAQLSGQLQGAGKEAFLDAALHAAHALLYDEELTADERATLDEKAFDDSVDPAALVLGQRLERALNAGAEAAELEKPQTPLSVIVLRGSGEKQLTRVVSRLREHLAAQGPGARGRLLLVAAHQVYEKVKQLLPGGRVGGLPTIEYHDDGARASSFTAPIEIVSADVSLGTLEKRASMRIDEIRRRSVDTDSSTAGQLAGTAGDAEALEPTALLDPDDGTGYEQPTVRVSKSTSMGDAATEDIDPMIGQLFHLKYRIVRRIGKGGFGSVYEAADERGAGNRVAIKVLKSKLAKSVTHQQSFKDEARRVTRLSHPNVVDWKVFDETESGLSYFVMELVEGEEFEQTLRRERKLEPARAARLLLQVLDALRAAHNLSKRESILHLDLKPANIFRIPPRGGREEQVKVIDFGIGQYIGDEEVQNETVIPAEGIRTGDIEGPSTLTFTIPSGTRITSTQVNRSKGCTPEYASPEQCEHVMYKEDIVPLDGRSDLYSLGVVGFEMLTGQLPFKSKQRLDVMQMHCEDAPPKVGSMGVHVPRKLARFIDRCLQKDRDKRWKDTDEAYQFLHDIVHPPVWKAVAKVTVPIVLAGVAIGSWAWATREIVIPTVGLVSADGGDLATRTLFLGPERLQAQLSLMAAEGVLPDDTTGVWRVQRVSDATPLLGWEAAWSGPGTVALRPPENLTGRVEERIELVLGKDTLRSRPASVVWIGPGTWEVSEIRVGERPLDELRGMALDPFGTNLDLWVRGEARAELAVVSVQVGDHAPLPLARLTSSGERSHYRLDLSDAGLSEGENELRWLLRDAADKTWTRPAQLKVVRGVPALERFSIVDGAGERNAAGEWPESNKILNTFTISPRTRPVLRVDVSRLANVGWKVFVEGSDEPEMRGQSVGKRSVEADLDGLDKLKGGKSYRGRIELEVVEDAYIMHAPGSGRGELTRSIAFSFEDTLPTFGAQWRVDGVSRALETGEGGSVLFTNAAEAEVVVTGTQPVPMRVEIAWWPNDQPDDIRIEASQDVDSTLTQQAKVLVALDEDGEWTLRARSYRYDTAAKTIGDRPDVEQIYQIVLDRSAPGAVLIGLDKGQVIGASESAPEELRVQFEELPGRARATEVDLDWRLVRMEPYELISSGHLQGHDPTIGDARVGLNGSLKNSNLVDGAYRIEASGIDRAGNSVREASVDFVVAVHGPKISLKEPVPSIGKWHRDPTSRRWTVRAVADDPNGVGDVECRLIAGETETPIVLQPESGSTSEKRALFGSVAITHEMSESKVKLAFSASDSHGAVTSWTSEEIDLPSIARPSPDRITVAFGAVQVEPMRLVRGNSEFQYLFGGRGDAVENPAFVRAGLALFNSSARRSRSRSWQVPFETGAIKDYYLDEREVSVAQYLDFLRDPGGYAEPRHWPPGEGPDAQGQSALLSALEAGADDLPVTGISWVEASAYARWLGKRLPSWVEWEYAVRGGADYRPYASYDRNGHRDDERQANALSSALEARPVEAAARQSGGDWTADKRFADLCGNVAEWTCTGIDGEAETGRYPHQWALENPEQLAAHDLLADRYWIVGGHYEQGRSDFAVADHRPATYRHATIGFRCAVSLEEVQNRIGNENQDGPNFVEQP